MIGGWIEKIRSKESHEDAEDEDGETGKEPEAFGWVGTGEWQVETNEETDHPPSLKLRRARKEEGNRSWGIHIDL